MKVSYLVLMAIFCTLLLGGGKAEAYIGYGYRANETVRTDRCYRGLAWYYAVPFYIAGPKQRYYYRKKCLKR